MKSSDDQSSRRKSQKQAAGDSFAASVVRKALKLPLILVSLIFNSRMTVWLETRMVRAYSSSNHFTRSVILSLWHLIYKVVLLVRTGLTFEIHRMEGVLAGQTEPVTVIYFQTGRGMAFLKKQLFGENACRQEQIGSCRFYQLAQRAKEAASNADMVIIERVTLLRWTPSTGFWQRSPTWVSMAMEINPRQTWKEAQRQLRSQHSNIRLMKKNGFTYRISHNPEDFEAFYEHMYKPYLAKRYQDIFIAEGKPRLRDIFNRGFLAQICTADGEVVAGVISLRQGDVQFSVALGVLYANTTWLDAGVLSAIYYFQVKHAHEDGLRRVDFGGARPFVKDGLYQYKYRWGARPILDYWNPREWLIWIPKGSSAVQRWVSENPIVPEWCHTGGQIAPELLDAAQDTAA